MDSAADAEQTAIHEETPRTEQHDEESKLYKSHSIDVQIFETPDSELPPLPVEDSSEDLSFVDPSGSQLDSDASAMLEKDMKRKLMDMESSFIPDTSAHEDRPAKGADDTYLFGGSPGNGRSREELPKIAEEPPTPASAYRTAQSHSSDAVGGADEHTNGTSEVEEDITSPTAAAAQRAHTRSRSQEDATIEPDGDIGTRPEIPKRSSSKTPTRPAAPSGSYDGEYGMPTPSLSPEANSDGTITSLQSPLHTMASARLLKRPSFLSSRQASNRSSIASFASDGTDITVGADYALQSGGAAPTSNQTTSSISLSRLPSLGSIASSINSSHSDTQPPWNRSRSSTTISALHPDGSLGRLDEEHRNDESPPATPRPYSSGGAAPTDTVIAQHVQNIHVPETVAREYRERHSARSPERRTAGLSHRKSNLTLKEQNSKIDKLSKENFDLKLKIHFLDQALQNRSDEGVKEMITRNVQLQTDLASEKKENANLRRKVRELERRLKAQEEGMQAAKEAPSDDDASEKSERYAEMEEEILMLREVVNTSENEITRLKNEAVKREVERRRMAEHVKSLTERKPSETTAGVEEAMDMWRELLEAETARREQADEDAARLRDEIKRLKADAATTPSTTNHVKNVYNINKRQQVSYSTTQSEAGQSETATDENGTASTSTFVETLRHENAELRRDLSAQTSMLTSRNRERERLQQEIEELKLHARRGGVGDGVRSVAGDSIFERSVSRAHQRPSSRASGVTRVTQISDAERDEYEKRQASLRDELAQTKMVNQDLERELNAHLDLLQNVEAERDTFKRENGEMTEDLQALQQERDEALANLEEKEERYEELREEAIQTIDELEKDLEQKDTDFVALQEEMKAVSERVVGLEDELSASRRKEQQLEQQLEENERELEALDKKLRDTVEKNERLDVQLESCQGEIQFLRSEQDDDKLRIGEYEAAVSNSEERIRELESQMREEKRQREILDSQEKQSTQRLLDDLNSQLAKARKEIAQLRKNLTQKETEASTWKERCETLESGLREALGDAQGTRLSLLKVLCNRLRFAESRMLTFSQDVIKLTRDLEHTVTSLNTAQQDLAEKERTLKGRDQLLESTALETRKLSDLLDKERAARQKDRASFDQMQRSQQSLTRTLQQNDTRAQEFENLRKQDLRKYAHAEQQLRDMIAERNNFLLGMWNRLSTLCGAEFMQKNSLVDGQLPSPDVIAKNLRGFAANVDLALRTIEAVINGFRSRIREVEKSLWKEFQTLEHAIDVRTKRIDHLEKMVSAQQKQLDSQQALPLPSPSQPPAINPRSASRSSTRSHSSEITKLKNENKLLKAELKFQRTTSPTRSYHGHRSSVESANLQIPQLSPDRVRDGSGVPTRGSSHRASITSTLLRHHSTSAVEALQSQQRQQQQLDQQRLALAGANEPIPETDDNSPVRHASQPMPNAIQPLGREPLQPREQRWIHKLKELERRLKAEREARLLDRSGARKRLEEERGENEELRRMLERERERRESLETEAARDGLASRDSATVRRSESLAGEREKATAGPA